MLLGQLVAISVASNLFYVALLSSSPKPQPSKKSQNATISLALYLPVLVSFATIAYSPYTSVDGGTFIINLLFMHTLIVVPLVRSPTSIASMPTIRLRTFAIITSVLSVLLHVRATTIAWAGISQHPRSASVLETGRLFIAAAWDTLHAYHPAQSSIGWDVVWTSVSFMVWGLIGDMEKIGKRQPEGKRPIIFLLATPLLSAGGSAPWTFSTGKESFPGLRSE